jgi:hypothetical protein
VLCSILASTKIVSPKSLFFLIQLSQGESTLKCFAVAPKLAQRIWPTGTPGQVGMWLTRGRVGCGRVWAQV